jgi:hypothetical protein
MDAVTYTKESIIEKVQSAIAPKTLFCEPFVNYAGEVGGERYTEIIARELLNHLVLLSYIPTIARENYKAESHAILAQGEQSDVSHRDEEWIAKGLYGKTLAVIGKILDYQTPLKKAQNDKAGKIDLFSYNKDSSTAYILELKREDSSETLLRCALEAYTYWKTAHHANLLRSFCLPDDTEIRKAVLIYKDSQPYRDFEPKGTAVRQLMRELGVDFIVIDGDNAKEEIV